MSLRLMGCGLAHGAAISRTITGDEIERQTNGDCQSDESNDNGSPHRASLMLDPCPFKDAIAYFDRTFGG